MLRLPTIKAKRIDNEVIFFTPGSLGLLFPHGFLQGYPRQSERGPKHHH